MRKLLGCHLINVKKKKYKGVSNARQFIEYQTPPKMDLLNYSNCYFNQIGFYFNIIINNGISIRINVL